MLPAEILLGGQRFMTRGAASATLNATQQIGGSLGVALLNTFFTTASTDYVTSHQPSPLTPLEGIVDGTQVVFWWSGGLLPVGALVAALVINARCSALPTGAAPAHVG